MANPRVWSRKCLIDITKLVASNGDSTDLSLRAITRDITIDAGGRPMTAAALVNDGFVDALENEDKTTVTLRGYTTTAGRSGGHTVNSISYLLGLHGLFYEGSDGTAPIAVDSNVIEPTQLRLAILFTNSGSETKATSASALAGYAFRATFANGYITSPPSFEFTGNPKVLEMTATFEFAPRNKYGFPNFHFEDNWGDAAANLPALNNYNETNYGETVATRTW